MKTIDTYIGEASEVTRSFAFSAICFWPTEYRHIVHPFYMATCFCGSNCIVFAFGGY